MSLNLTNRWSQHFIRKRLFSCRYQPPVFFRFGYIGAFLIGSVFFTGLRNCHIVILRNIDDVKKELNDIKCIINKKE
jgi:hypothetical protein